jgi:hypothetical protein
MFRFFHSPAGLTGETLDGIPRHGAPTLRRSLRRPAWKWFRRLATLVILSVVILFLPVGTAPYIHRVTVPPGVAEVSLAAGEQYEAGPIHRFLLGGEYRSLWTEPITVPVLDLRGFDGGLRVSREGGGMQSHTLHLVSARGNHFLFRSVDKELVRLATPRIGRSYFGSILQDQTSASHPAGVLVAAPLQAAAGLPNSHPRFVVLPDDSVLGAFQATYSGMLGTFQQSPAYDAGGSTGAPIRILHTEELLPILDASPVHHIDAEKFLTARLLDLFLNDWDRHEGQWRWQEVARSADTLWEPIPIDRDQAFASYDGLILKAVRLRHPKLISFGPHYASLVGLTTNSALLDARFLGGIPRATWDSTVRWLVAQLSDSTIASAIRQMPPPYRRLNGEALDATLRERRAGLPHITERFYQRMAREVEAHGTASDERITINQADDGTVTVAITPASDAHRTEYLRRLDPSETHAVRVFLHGGRDVVVSSTARPAIAVRIIDGESNSLSLADYLAHQSQREPSSPVAD